jgi:hypothetical protein
MDTETVDLSYAQITKAIRAFKRVVDWVRDGDLTFDLNYNLSMHEEVKEQVEEAQDAINDKYQREMEDGTKLFLAPDGRLVAKIEKRLMYVREVEGEAHEEGTELRPTGLEYIDDEDREEVVRTTQQGQITQADLKQRRLRIATGDRGAYEEELQSLNDRTFSVPYVPIDPAKIRDDDNVDSSRSVNYSAIMHVFEGVETTPDVDGDGLLNEINEEVSEDV